MQVPHLSLGISTKHGWETNKKLAQYITNRKPVLLVEYYILTKSTTKPALPVEHPTRSNQTTTTERRVLIKLKNTMEIDGKGKEGAHNPTQRTSTSPGPYGAISRLGRTGVAGPATEEVGRAAVVATLASSSRGWSCGPFPGLLRCPLPGHRHCSRGSACLHPRRPCHRLSSRAGPQ
jgi:hypothetical protein